MGASNPPKWSGVAIYEKQPMVASKEKSSFHTTWMIFDDYCSLWTYVGAPVLLEKLCCFRKSELRELGFLSKSKPQCLSLSLQFITPCAQL